MLNDYLKQCQRLLRDGDQKLVNPADLIDWINLARRRLAQQTQCIRVLSPISGQVSTISVTAGGSGYSATPTITISEPDFPSHEGAFPNGAQATASAVVTAGVITDIQVDYGGAGYFQPTVTITDSTGSGATATAETSPLSVTQQGKEVYTFADIPLDNFPGVGEVLAVKSVSFIYANYRYSLPCYSFSTYQARIRQYPTQYQYVPTMCAQFGQGVNGSIYMYPLPSTAYQFEFDCICLPIDLTSDDDPEAIPLPWTDAVPFLAVSYAYRSLQNPNFASYYEQSYENYMKMHSTAARPGRRVNPYGSW